MSNLVRDMQDLIDSNAESLPGDFHRRACELTKQIFDSFHADGDDETGDAQADSLCAKQKSHFRSIPATTWWCIVTMTTVGYGDMYPVTVFGKVIAVPTMLAGILIFALPITVIGSNYETAYHNEVSSTPYAASSGKYPPQRGDAHAHAHARAWLVCMRRAYAVHTHTPCTRRAHTCTHMPHACASCQVMRRLIDDIVAGIKEHFKTKTEKGETEEVTLKEVQTLAKKWSSRCARK